MMLIMASVQCSGGEPWCPCGSSLTHKNPHKQGFRQSKPPRSDLDRGHFEARWTPSALQSSFCAVAAPVVRVGDMSSGWWGCLICQGVWDDETGLR